MKLHVQLWGILTHSHLVHLREDVSSPTHADTGTSALHDSWKLSSAEETSGSCHHPDLVLQGLYLCAPPIHI